MQLVFPFHPILLLLLPPSRSHFLVASPRPLFLLFVFLLQSDPFESSWQSCKPPASPDCKSRSNFGTYLGPARKTFGGDFGFVPSILFLFAFWAAYNLRFRKRGACAGCALCILCRPGPMLFKDVKLCMHQNMTKLTVLC